MDNTTLIILIIILFFVFGGVMSGMFALITLARAFYYLVGRKDVM